MRFARRSGVASVPDRYFLTHGRIKQFEAARSAEKGLPAHPAVTDDELGTVGAVARDRAGNLAAATSTGGTANKRPGRIGDSPVIGAGVWADNATCAVSCSGIGEDFMRTVLAKTAADLIEMRGLDAGTAATGATEYLARKVSGRGGLILVDRLGRCASRFTTPRMIRGWIEDGGEAACTF
jgi:beta-aspartyl-peptidase (threonine type)